LSTLFLHEDILARVLSYELELRDWRVAETLAGRGDPGRPSYEEVFLSISSASCSNKDPPGFRWLNRNTTPFPHGVPLL
jgi:hypothetical protein